MHVTPLHRKGDDDSPQERDYEAAKQRMILIFMAAFIVLGTLAYLAHEHKIARDKKEKQVQPISQAGPFSFKS